MLLVKKYQKSLLKYFVGIQFNLIISALFILYIILIIGENSIDKIFNQVCMESIVNSTRTQICPSTLVKNSFFNWKNEILHRKLSFSNNYDTSESRINSKASYLSMALSRSNLSSSGLTSDGMVKQSPIEDIYLLLISVSLVTFSYHSLYRLF